MSTYGDSLYPEPISGASNVPANSVGSQPVIGSILGDTKLPLETRLHIVYALHMNKYLASAEQYGSENFRVLRGLSFCFTDLTFLTDTCYGPARLNDPDENNYNTLWYVRINLDATVDRVVYGIVGTDTEYSADEFLLAGEAPEQVSISFDSVGDPTISFIEAGQLTIRRETAGVMTTYGPFTAKTHQLFYNGILLNYITDAGDRDVVAYYSKENDSNLYARYQRDNFGVEYTIITNLPENIKMLFMEVTTSQKLFLYGFTEGHRGFMIESSNYPPFAVGIEDIGISAAFLSGEYVAQVIVLDTVEEQLGLTAGFTEGVYFDVIYELNADEAIGLTGSFTEGSYDLVVVVLTPQEEDLGLSATFIDGEYVLRVVSAGTIEDTIGLSATFTEGTYAIA